MASEKSLLVELVAKHFPIIENKKTDGTTLRQKSEEWKIIMQEYNSQTALIPRLAENLKAQWEAMKIAAKKRGCKYKNGYSRQDPWSPLSVQQD
ncbi:unnamed protein product [Parnassius apollo]|uniref:Regulatory protein zeste n=1 Tax=Parnassius apollo TaxID=110799 RepID=A0A8S3XQJ9_PARAO|nr:unnamed protein product [Parnassius apollo]